MFGLVAMADATKTVVQLVANTVAPASFSCMTSTEEAVVNLLTMLPVCGCEKPGKPCRSFSE